MQFFFSTQKPRLNASQIIAEVLQHIFRAPLVVHSKLAPQQLEDWAIVFVGISENAE
jgi:hypothetical protein